MIKRLLQSLEENFPLILRRLTIVDESDQHAGHAGSRMLASPSGETHFRVGIVSSAFSGLNTVKRHRLVYQVSCTCLLYHPRAGCMSYRTMGVSHAVPLCRS